jgi:hypothetical protein
VIVALAIAALYFVLAAVLELLEITGRLPLAPTPWLGLCVSMINLCLVIGLFNAVGWVRPLLILLPLAAYPLEYGFSVPKLLSIQSAELVAAGVLMPAAVIYYLYLERSVRDWFSTPHSQ